ncbi:unnamed protein product [Lampetra planeri]
MGVAVSGARNYEVLQESAAVASDAGDFEFVNNGANSLEQQHERAELAQAELVAMQAWLGEHKVECERMLQNEKCRAREELDNTRGKMEFIKAELGVSKAEEAATAQEVLFENNKQLGSLQAGIQGYQRMVADLHAELVPSHENLQSLHAQLQDLQVLHQQSEAKKWSCLHEMDTSKTVRAHDPGQSGNHEEMSQQASDGESEAMPTLQQPSRPPDIPLQLGGGLQDAHSRLAELLLAAASILAEITQSRGGVADER